MSQLSYTLEQIVEYLVADIDVSLVGDSAYKIDGINTLKESGKQELSFLSNPKYSSYLSETMAGCVILHPENQHHFAGNKLVTSDPYYAYALLTSLFVTNNTTKGSVHPTVCAGEGSHIADDVSIAANVVLGANVTVEQGVRIGANSTVGDNCVIKRSVTIYPNVALYKDVIIGENSVIHSHATIGADGFGFSPKPSGNGWQKIHQLGGVVIGDDVEVGAGTTIDRGALGDTVIGDGVKLDNHIQVAHNVSIGDYTAIASSTAIAGSASIGKRCTISGAVGIAGHITIVDDVHITAMTMVTKSINSPGSYSSGTPMNKTTLWRKNAARFNRLDEIAKQVSVLKNMLKK